MIAGRLSAPPSVQPLSVSPFSVGLWGPLSFPYPILPPCGAGGEVTVWGAWPPALGCEEHLSHPIAAGGARALLLVACGGTRRI